MTLPNEVWNNASGGAAIVLSGHVGATIVDAFSSGFLTLVPEDGVGDQAQGPHDANLLDCQRRYCEVTTTDACIEYLRRRAAA